MKSVFGLKNLKVQHKFVLIPAYCHTNTRFNWVDEDTGVVCILEGDDREIEQLKLPYNWKYMIFRKAEHGGATVNFKDMINYK